MINKDGYHHTFVIARCENNRTLLFRHILRWQQIHGPNTRVLVVAYIEWRWIVPQELEYQRKRGGYAGRDDR